MLHGERAGVVERHERHAEHGEVHRERDHEEQDLVRAAHDAALDALHVAFGAHIGQFGKHCRGDGHRQKRIRQREPQARIREDGRAVVGEVVRRGVLHRHHRKRAKHDDDRRHADAERLAQGRVAQVHARADADAVAFERRQLDGHLHDDACGIADGDDVKREVRVARRHERIRQKREDDDDVVRHRRDG